MGCFVCLWFCCLLVFCFEFYFILSAKVSVCDTRSTTQPCSGNSGSFWAVPRWTLTQKGSFLCMSQLQKGLYLREGRKRKEKKETCFTSDGKLAAWVPVLCSWVLCSLLICELCLNVFLQLDVQRDVSPLMFHGIYFYAAALLRALIIALLLLALDFYETCRNFVRLGFLFFCQTGRKLANE